MWISKKELHDLQHRIADLEITVQSQQKMINQINYPYESLKQAFAECVRHQEMAEDIFKLRHCVLDNLLDK